MGRWIIDVGQDYCEDGDQLISWFRARGSDRVDIEPINEQECKVFKVALNGEGIIRRSGGFYPRRIPTIGRIIWQSHRTTPVSL